MEDWRGFGNPVVAVGTADNVYVAYGARIQRIERVGVITAMAATGEDGYSRDGGPATEARLSQVICVAADLAGVYVRRGKALNPSGCWSRNRRRGKRGWSGCCCPATAEWAERLVGWYERRWAIEEYFRLLKTGTHRGPPAGERAGTGQVPGVRRDHGLAGVQLGTLRPGRTPDAGCGGALAGLPATVDDGALPPGATARADVGRPG